ncbi:MAG: ABC transporter permease, partial [Bacteroidales bacterium]|nr:ABC transporter permease [Bacteroidales bacterium]
MKGFLNISPLFRENLSVAFRSILSNRLRSVLTILIIAVGITCLVGTETAIEVITSSVSDAYSSMGASSFTISARSSASSTLSGERLKNSESLTYRQVTEFIDNYDFPAKKTIFITVEANQTAKSAQASTDPNVRLKGIQGDYLEYSGLKIESGRPISLAEQKRGENVCLIGNGVAKKLFKGESAEDKMISVGQGVFRVLGVMEEKGSLLGGSDDDAVLIPITTARKWVTENNSYSIGILPDNPEMMQKAI